MISQIWKSAFQFTWGKVSYDLHQIDCDDQISIYQTAGHKHRLCPKIRDVFRNFYYSFSTYISITKDMNELVCGKQYLWHFFECQFLQRIALSSDTSKNDG